MSTVKSSVSVKSLTLDRLDTITAVYVALCELSSAEIRLAGLAWYRLAHELAVELAAEHRTSTEVAAGVLSALSPQTAWDTNVLAARDVLARGHHARRPTGTHWQSGDNMQKALAIVAAQSIDGRFTADTKTWAFTDNILHWDTSARVTLDSWALRTVGLPESAKGTAYRLLSSAITSAAEQLRILPSQCQAIVWLMARDVLKLRHGQYVTIVDRVPIVAGVPVPKPNKKTRAMAARAA